MTYFDGTSYGNYSKTFSTFYDFSTMEKKCSYRRFYKTTTLIQQKIPWCLYEGGPNGRIFGYLPTDDTDPNTGQGKSFDCLGYLSGQTPYSNAIPCLIGDPEQSTLVENTNEGQLFFPVGCASLSPINPCVFGARPNRGAYTGGTKNLRFGQSFGSYFANSIDAGYVSTGNFMPYSGQSFPVDFSYGGTGTGTYTLEIQP